MIRIFVLIVFLLSGSVGCFSQDILKLTSGAVFTIQAGASVFINGGVDLDDNSSLIQSGHVTIAGSPTRVANLTDKSGQPYHYGNGTFLFSGNSQQIINSLNVFGKVVFDNAGTNLGSDLQSDNWTFKSGVISTGNFLLITKSSLQSALSADASNPGFTKSWVHGKLRRSVSPSTVNSYIFPVGDAGKSNMIEIDNLMAAPIAGVSTLTAFFAAKPGTDAGLAASELGTTYAAVSTGGVWHLVPDQVPASGKFDLKVYFNGFGSLSDNSFGMLQRPDNSSVGSEWQVPAGSVLPGSGSPGRTLAAGYARRNNLGTFGQFGIATALSVLPLQLLSFSAIKKDQSVILQWTTDNETNTSHFEVYRSGELISAQSIGTVPAAGSSSSLKHYSFTDKQPLHGMNYYQLKMVDTDQKFSLSKSVKVNFENPASLTVYPNPVKGNVLYVSYEGGAVTSIKLITLDGKEVPCSFVSSGSNQLKLDLGAVHAKGTYALHLTTRQGVVIRMVVLQ